MTRHSFEKYYLRSCNPLNIGDVRAERACLMQWDLGDGDTI